MTDCPLMNFAAKVAVQRLTDENSDVVRNFLAEITISCADCGSPFHFLGADAGLSFVRPTVSVGAVTLNAPIAPGEGPIPERIRYEVPGRKFE